VGLFANLANLQVTLDLLLLLASIQRRLPCVQKAHALALFHYLQHNCGCFLWIASTGGCYGPQPVEDRTDHYWLRFAWQAQSHSLVNLVNPIIHSLVNPIMQQ